MRWRIAEERGGAWLGVLPRGGRTGNLLGFEGFGAIAGTLQLKGIEECHGAWSMLEQWLVRWS